MVKYCSECGNEIEAGFKFCTECGKKLMIRPTSCPDCGAKLKEKFKFCSGCGREIFPSKEKSMPKPKKTEKTETSKMVEEIKPVAKPKSGKKKKTKISLPKISFNLKNKVKLPGKKVLLILLVVCIVIVAAAAVYILFNPFKNTGTSPSGGGTLSITVENMHSGSVNYYLMVDNFPVAGSLDNPIVMDSDDAPLNLNINEDDLTIVKNVHTVTLFASFDDTPMVSCIASDVTESASFEISVENEAIVITCTASQ